MKRHLFVSILLLALMPSCDSGSKIALFATPTPTATATFTPTPTNTPTPTSTPTNTPTSTPTPTPEPTATPTPTFTPTPAPTVYIQDDFSEPGDNNWYLDVDDNRLSGGEIIDGQYWLFTRDPESAAQVTYFHPLADFAASVDIQFRADVSGSGLAGLVFRQGSDYKSYEFDISVDGMYSLDKYDGEDFTSIVNWRHSDAIRRGAAVNQITVLAEGSHLTLIINGQVVDEVDDDAFTEGDFALIVWTNKPAGTEVSFDNFLVTNLAAWNAQPPALPIPTPTPSEFELVLEDDFSTREGRWLEFNESYGQAAYRNGQLVLETFEAKVAIVSSRLDRVSDFILEVEAQMLATPGHGSWYGVYFRRVDTDNSYAFEVNPDGFFVFARSIEGEFFEIESGEASDVILPGNAVNHLTISALGAHLVLSINGQTIVEVDDITFREGQIGLVLDTSSAGAQVAYDNLVLRVPKY